MADRKLRIFPSAARTDTGSPHNSADLVFPDEFKGAVFFLDITASSGTPTLDVKLQYKDHLSGKYIDVPGAAFAQKTGTGSDTLTVYPGIGETTNRSVSDVLSETFRAVATIAGTTPSFTFSLSAEFVS